MDTLLPKNWKANLWKMLWHVEQQQQLLSTRIAPIHLLQTFTPAPSATFWSNRLLIFKNICVIMLRINAGTIQRNPCLTMINLLPPIVQPVLFDCFQNMSSACQFEERARVSHAERALIGRSSKCLHLPFLPAQVLANHGVVSSFESKFSLFDERSNFVAFFWWGGGRLWQF